MQEIHPSFTSHTSPSGDLACNPGMCPDWESNWQPFGLQYDAQPTEPHQSEHPFPLNWVKSFLSYDHKSLSQSTLSFNCNSLLFSKSEPLFLPPQVPFILQLTEIPGCYPQCTGLTRKRSLQSSGC